MKRIRQFVFAAMLLLVMTPVWGQTYFSVNGIHYRVTNSVDPYEVEVNPGGEYFGDVVIPESVSNEGVIYSVTSIGYRAFQDCVGLTSIDIPNSVTSIGHYAFNGCCNLTFIDIPDAVTVIERGTFEGCSSLTSIDIPNVMMSIGEDAFRECVGLAFIDIPNSVTSIGFSAFDGCVGLTSLTIGNSLTSIGQSAFSWCNSLTNIVVSSGNPKYDSRNNCNAIIETETNTLLFGCQTSFIPNSVTSIGNRAFLGCVGLTSIDIPNSVTSIGYYAFLGCVGLTSIDIPNSVTSIGYYAFSGCSNLTFIDIPDAVTVIEKGTFEGCSSLTSIDIPNSVTSIGYYAFNMCVGLTSLTIGNSVTSIEFAAFQDCVGLTSIDIPNSVTSIELCAFQGCVGLTSLMIGNSLTSIGQRAFSGCNSLTNIVVSSGNPKYDSRNNCNAIIETETNTLLFGCQTSFIPNSVTSIGDYAFYDCVGLASIDIPNSVTSIGDYAFCNCDGLSSVDIPNSVTSIGALAFDECDGLTSVFIPNSVANIGEGAFSCPNITTIKVDLNNPVYDSRDNCNAIIKTDSIILVQGCMTTVMFPSITKIGRLAFAYCRGMASISIPNSVMDIGPLAFLNSGLTSVVVPTSVTCIEYGTFYGCDELTTVTLGNSVTDIKSSAFEACTNLSNLTIKASTPPCIDDRVFGYDYDYDNLPFDDILLYVPCGRREAYANTDVWKKFHNIVDSLFLYDVEVRSSDESLGSVSITQHPNCENNHVTVAADPIGDHPFLSWTVNGNVVSYANPYTFTVEDDIELVANFYGTGLDEETMQTITVSPNPAQNHMNIECENMRSITLCTLDGKVSRTCKVNGDAYTMDMTGLAKGIYILRIETQDGLVVNRKIVKE